MTGVARDHRDDGCAQPAATLLVVAGLLVALVRRAAQ